MMQEDQKYIRLPLTVWQMVDKYLCKSPFGEIEGLINIIRKHLKVCSDEQIGNMTKIGEKEDGSTYNQIQGNTE